MNKVRPVALATVAALAAVFTANSASAQSIANTTQLGSLLIWPLITIDKSSQSATYGQEDTLVELSNNANKRIQVECFYVNETKARVDFSFRLTAKQTVSWDVLTHTGDRVVVPAFPTSQGKYSGGDLYRGELVCFAVDLAVSEQVAWNELAGTATVLSLADAQAKEPKEDFKYNAWAFCARNANGCAPDNKSVAQGTPGNLQLTGQNAAGVYDACPAINVANFMPNGAKLSNVKTLDNNLAVSSCDQDLTENYKIYMTELDFMVWNATEKGFSGAYECADSVETVPLSDTNTNLVNATNFDYATLGTPDGRFEVSSSGAGACNTGNTVGLLGILHSATALKGDKAADAQAGSTLQGVGAQSGFVLWDPN